MAEMARDDRDRSVYRVVRGEVHRRLSAQGKANRV